MNNLSAYLGIRILIRPAVQLPTPVARWFQSIAEIRHFASIILALLFLSAYTAHAQTTSGNASTGNTLFNSSFNCHNCHTASSANRFNAINAGGRISLANAKGMGGSAGNAQNYADIAAYLGTLFADLGTQSVSFNTAKGFTIPNFALPSTYGDYTGLVTNSGPSRGSIGYSGLNATYTPFTGQCGPDSFTYFAQGSGGGTSNLRGVNLSIANPSGPNITGSAGTMSGTYNTVIASFFPSNSGGTPLSYIISAGLPTGLSFNTGNGSISGTPVQVGTFNVTVTARNCLNGNLTGQSSSRAIAITIAKGAQAPIGFAALPPKLTGDAPFTVSAAGGGSTSPVTFTAAGVCSSSGTNGSTITLTGAMGTCTVTANQAGDVNYLAAAPVVQNFSVVAPGELFPPNCQMPQGFFTPGTANAGWTVASDFASNGVCSLKSNDIADSQKAQVSYSATFLAGNITFSQRVSTEGFYDCLHFYIDTIPQNIGGAGCANGETGLSGSGTTFGPVSVPITAGAHTLMWSYEKDASVSTILDAVWIDELVLPIAPTAIVSASTAPGSVGQFFYYFINATNSPWNYSATGIPPGVAIDQFGQIFGTPTAIGTYNMMITATNGSSSATQAVTVTIAQGAQPIIFASLPNKRFTDPIFGVSATGGGSGNPITWSASGVCINGGINGDIIQLSGALGTCSVTASQLGNANYLDAVPVTQTFLVFNPAQEYFPPNCVMPAGWTPGGTLGWTVAQDASSEGGCSLRSGVITDGQNSQISVFVFTAAGNITFKRRVSSEASFDCFQFILDTVPQNVGGTCSNVGLVGISGESPFASFSFPVASGFHTLLFSYSKDGSVSRGSDAAWVDDLVIPQIIVTVNKTGGGTGTITSDPVGINCGLTCAGAFSNTTNGGLVDLIATPTAGSYLASWSGAGCSGNGACSVSTSPAPTVTATFSLITVPTAPTGVAAVPGNQSASVSFVPPAFNGGSAIIDYTATCGSNIGSGAGSPVVVNGLTNGVTINCKVVANNIQGSSPPSSPLVPVTPRTTPTAPQNFAVAPGNGSATLTFTAPTSDGGAAITGYIGVCFNGPTTIFGNSVVSPIVITGFTNGITYQCRMAAQNAAGTGLIAGDLPVTPRTLPGAPTNLAAAPRDGRAIFSFDAPVSDGGNAISSYVISCNGGAITAMGAFAPITMNGLTNGVTLNCTVAAINAAGTGPVATFASVTPGVQPGVTYWGNICSSCHGMTPSVPQLNAAGTTGTVLNYAIANQPSMTGNPAIVGLTNAEKNAIAVYLASVIPPSAETTPFNTPKLIDLASQISVGTISFELLESMTPPLFGTLSSFNGTQITYTPNAGSVGMDTFTFRGRRDVPSQLLGDQRTVNIDVQPPPVPVITSMLTASGTNGVPFNYQSTASNNPTSYGAMNLPTGLSIDPVSGAITGTPLVGGSFMVSLTATNQGGTGMASTLTLTLNPAGQTISFPAQSPTQPFSPGGTFPISPPATASSTLPVSYVSKTTGVCMVNGTTAMMVIAGTCTIGANQGGNINFAAAVEATRDVTINPTIPGAPNIGSATPGNNQAVVAFTAPTNTGGVAISGYTAMCTAMGQAPRTGTGSMSPIVVSGMTNLVQYTCSVTATNSQGIGPASGNALVTPDQIPMAAAIVSAASATFTVNAPGSFSIVATGYPATFTYAVTGTLPMGVTLNTMTGVLSGTPTQAGTFNTVTLSATNSGGTGMQPFTLTVNQANQTISFSNPGTQSFSAVSVALSAVATSGLGVTFVSDTTSVCTVAGSNATLVGIGTCTIRAQQTGNANFNIAPDAPQSFSVTQGSQSINFGAQMSPRAYVASGTFGLSPVAFATSGLSISYTSLTSGVCTISVTTVTMVSAGNCTIAANQVGNANYSAAAQVTQSITLTGSAPGAPTLNSATSGDTKITLAFSAPASNGGSSIASYTATCGGVTQAGSASPIAVTVLTNGMAYSCTVTATNAFGTSVASNSLMATPNPLAGASLWTTKQCGSCHGTPPSAFRLNVGGNSSTLLDYVIPIQPVMNALFGGGTPPISLSGAEKIAIAQYVQDNIPAVTATTPVNTAVGIDVSSQVILNSPIAALTALQIVSAPTNGMIGLISGATINYTPNNGFVGSDSFTYRATGATQTDVRTVTVIVTPGAPTITSSLTASGTIGQVFNYQIAASNGPTSYNATGLPAWASVSTMTGAITGTPNAGGTTMVTLSATGPGGTGMATLSLTVSLAPQTISFPAQTTGTRGYVQGGTFMVSPTATGGASGNPVAYSSSTSGVCTVSGTNVTMVGAGICTIAANQAGNAVYVAAPQVTQNVSITGTAPAAPTIGVATAGNTQATINFTAPGNTGGLLIASYTVNCNGVAVNGPGSPIVVSGLFNGVSYSCTVQATNLAGTSTVSGTVMVTPAAIMFTNIVYSRKLHGNGVGDKNLTVNAAPINGALTVEPRVIGTGHRIVFVFDNAVTSVTALTVRDANNVDVGTASPSFVGNELIVTLTNVPDNKRVTVTATGVNGAVDVSRAIGFLVGDVNGSLSVNASDISAVKSRNGASVSMGNNYLYDINVSGTITNADVSAVKARSGLVLAP